MPGPAQALACIAWQNAAARNNFNGDEAVASGGTAGRWSFSIGRSLRFHCHGDAGRGESARLFEVVRNNIRISYIS